MSYQFTCISCRVGFTDLEIQRAHYKTDWHRYNLKRKVVDLLPVTAEEFQRRVLNQKHLEEEGKKNDAVFCKVCRKMFSSSKAFENHINSKKHKIALCNRTSCTESEDSAFTDDISEPVNIAKEESKKFRPVRPIINPSESIDEEDDDDDEWEDMDSDELASTVDLTVYSDNNPILKNNCLFCENHSATVTKNFKHMSIAHSFFIPDIEYIVNLKNLLLYLGEKVCQFYLCLWCNLNGRAFQSMEAAQAHMRDKGHCKIVHEGEALAEYYPYYNYATSYPDYEEGMDVDEEVIPEELDGSEFTMKLPSGNTIGHRSLFIYYKQHLSHNNQVVVRKNKKLQTIISSYRALGWKPTDKEAAAKKAKDIHFIKKLQAKYWTKLGVRANKLQAHFRPQINF